MVTGEELADLLRPVHDRWNGHAYNDALWYIVQEGGKQSNKWNLEEFYAHGRAELAMIVAELERAFPNRVTGRALDFGCGVGRCTEALADYYDQVDGVDVSEEMIRLAGVYRPDSRCSYHVNNRPDLALFEDDTFDLAYSSICFQHMPASLTVRYAAEILRVLRPGGVYMLEVKTMDCEAPSPTEMTNWLEDAGAEPAESNLPEFYMGRKRI